MAYFQTITPVGVKAHTSRLSKEKAPSCNLAILGLTKGVLKQNIVLMRGGNREKPTVYNPEYLK